MRILYLTSHLDTGGITTYVVNLSEAFAARGHEVIVASNGGAMVPRLAAGGVAHWELPLRTKADCSLQVLRAARQLHRRLAKHPVDVMHAHTRTAQVAAHLAARGARIPYITTWHGFYRRRLGRRLWPCTGTRTIAISRQVAEHLEREFHVPPDRIRLIYHGVDADHFATAPDASALAVYRSRWPSDHRQVIGSVGRLASGGVKGFDLALAAAQHLLRQGLEIEVVIAGDGPRRAFLEGQAQHLGISDHVHFVGATDDVRVPLALMDVFVFASRWPEAFGLSLVEAMAAGRPVVAVHRGAVPEILEHERHGLLVPPENPTAMAEAIERLLTDPALARRLGLAAQQHARERFSRERMVREVEAVYREVVG